MEQERRSRVRDADRVMHFSSSNRKKCHAEQQDPGASVILKQKQAASCKKEKKSVAHVQVAVTPTIFSARSTW